MQNCLVKSNCKHNYDCDFCIEYKDYMPIDRRILSPPQLDRKEKRKDKKQTEASKRGKRNKRAGYSSEKRLEKLLNSWGFNCRRIPLSGALKTEGLDSDLRVEIHGKEYKIENKKRVSFNRYHQLTKRPIYIKDFCYMLSEKDFHGLLLGMKPEVVEIEDKRFKQLHDFFEQDNSDIVSMTSNYKPYIFALTKETWRELNESRR